MNKKINELLTRGVEEIIVLENLKSKLLSKKKLRVKLGIDPTSPNIHLGRTIPLLKLRDFQELGHQVVLIIGDFTGTIGDTSDKESERPMLDKKAVLKNMETYIFQAGKIIDINKSEIYHNSKWLNKLSYDEIGFQADQFSLNDFISRENIKKRLNFKKRVSLRELIYPLMQGYDSVVVKSDVEIGGTDQKFNVLAGRTLQKAYGQDPQDIILNPLIEGLDGRKMSSSWGNTVNIFDEPKDMFGKLMSLKDEYIVKYFILLTRVSLDEINDMKLRMKNGENPMIFKKRLAYEIVKMYHSESDAKKAQRNFEIQFQKRGVPKDLKKYEVGEGNIVYILNQIKFVSSNSEAKRKIKEGAVFLDGKRINDPFFVLKKGSKTIKLGKKMAKVIIS